MKSIIQDWAAKLGLRHQGVLVSAIRGCDTAPKDDPSKAMSRVLRSVVLNAHVGDPRKSKSFIEWIEEDEDFHHRARAFIHSMDQYPLHYVMHLLFAAEIVGYYHPDEKHRSRWFLFYRKAVHKLHLQIESKEELDARLNANEDDFGQAQVT